MNSYLSDYIKVVKPHLDSRLISSHNVDKIEQLAKDIPANPKTKFGCECRWGNSSLVDMGVFWGKKPDSFTINRYEC